jgi:lysophospholipase L1-like esterase
VAATRQQQRDEYAVRRDPTVLVVIAAVLAGVWWLRSGEPRAAAPTAGSQVVAFGDSLVAGVGTTTGRDFVSLLSERLGVPIVNAGKSGDTTGTALARLDSAVLSRDPRVVIVVLGGNDFLRRVPRDETFRNLDAIAARLRARGAAVVLAGLSLGIVTDGYSDGYEAVARERDAGLVPDILGGILGRPELMADNIHPNDRGHTLMADRLEPAVRELLKP